MTSINTLIQALNEAYGAELSAVIAYTQFSATITGLTMEETQENFQDEAHEELDHSFYFSDQLFALGGTPQPNVEYPPNHTSIPDMLRYLLEGEEEALELYTHIAELARQLGHNGIAVSVEEIIADEQKHSNHLLRMLR